VVFKARRGTCRIFQGMSSPALTTQAACFEKRAQGDGDDVSMLGSYHGQNHFEHILTVLIFPLFFLNIFQWIYFMG
jgi:hypothetical protein